MERYIKNNKQTAGHMAALVALGYEVVEAVLNIRKAGVVSEVAHLRITCTSVVEKLDLSTPELAAAAIKELVATKSVLSYGTEVKLPTEKVALNGPYVSKVAAVECRAKDGTLIKINLTPLVTKGAKVVKETKKALSLGSISLL